ncbi:MAG: hypothetical protein A3I29_00685 [Candidatus Magasanikbacteria bacterium RIFCSPLOWO2_02_FULL_44_11]|uniref:UPF0235 protein A3I29_00685 n=1 Tax=Candidatus Magasanikbacteria bacterium RIFCSPLOWO2_02_FULL_44_11 TaxID=1798689 RepID=A0A1F6NAF6_9BACT|nr:MAG: hypothetical protein A3I29_00685 [Candidatus Magasanikbacteria bacterium RIFCSPLOWO2_02_FULL_44_11]
MKITVRVVAGASKNEVVGTMADGSLKIKVMAPPVDGRANEAVRELLGAHFHCSKKQISIISGQTYSRKIIEIAI